MKRSPVRRTGNEDSSSSSVLKNVASLDFVLSMALSYSRVRRRAEKATAKNETLR